MFYCHLKKEASGRARFDFETRLVDGERQSSRDRCFRREGIERQLLTNGKRKRVFVDLQNCVFEVGDSGIVVDSQLMGV